MRLGCFASLGLGACLHLASAASLPESNNQHLWLRSRSCFPTFDAQTSRSTHVVGQECSVLERLHLSQQCNACFRGLVPPYVSCSAVEVFHGVCRCFLARLSVCNCCSFLGITCHCLRLAFLLCNARFCQRSNQHSVCIDNPHATLFTCCGRSGSTWRANSLSLGAQIS